MAAYRDEIATVPTAKIRGTAVAQIDYFLKIDGIDGESVDDKHKGEIELLHFNWSQTNTGSSGIGSGQGTGKVHKEDISCVKRFDKASAHLFLHSAVGTHIKKAVLVARKAGTKGQQEYLTITFEDVLISHYQITGDNEQVIPTDNFSLNFAKMTFSYKEQKEDGSLGGDIKKVYNYAKNKEE